MVEQWPNRYKVRSPVPQEEEEDKRGGAMQRNVTRIKTNDHRLGSIRAGKEDLPISFWKSVLISLHSIDFDTAIEGSLGDSCRRCSISMETQVLTSPSVPRGG